MVLVILDLANRELTRLRRQSRSMFSTLKPSSLPWFVNMRLIDWNGAVEHTSKINQVDMYLYIICYDRKLVMSSKELKKICVYFCQSAEWSYHKSSKDYAPHCNLLGIVNKKIRPAVKICNEESEEDVNGKETVDNVVDDKKSILLVSQECKLEWTNPGGVND